MNVTQDVIQDLLPVYFSGEASAATKALVDDFLSHDPAFAERVRREWQDPLATGGSATHGVPDVGLRSLHRTRRVLAVQRWLFSLALVFTLLPLSFEVSLNDGGIREFHFLIRDHPGLLGPMLGAGAVCWLLYARSRRQLEIQQTR